MSIDYQCATKSRSAWKQSLIVRYVFRAEFNVKTDKPSRAGWTELAGRIWPAGRTLPTPDLTWRSNNTMRCMTTLHKTLCSSTTCCAHSRTRTRLLTTVWTVISKHISACKSYLRKYMYSWWHWYNIKLFTLTKITTLNNKPQHQSAYVTFA